LLNRHQQQYGFRDDDREQIMSARRATEALFMPKPQVTERTVLERLPPADPSARKPRVLPILSPTSIRHEEIEAPISSKRQTVPDIPAKKFARIRALVKYGMTVAQVAELYGVPVEAIKPILRKLDSDSAC
jgi:hypothetical protein